MEKKKLSWKKYKMVFKVISYIIYSFIFYLLNINEVRKYIFFLEGIVIFMLIDIDFIDFFIGRESK